MLDPHRIGLNAESIGFQKRMQQDLDWNAIHTALQTDYNNQNSAVQVRREKEAAKNEIRVMGGQLSGFENNELILTYSRQQRQINGYPLRHFDAENPAVVLPKKYGGFPLYNRNQTEYPELVSVFTEPMSAPLQRDTELLGRAGAVAMSNDLNTPYSPQGFLNPMDRTMSELEQNKSVFIQRKHLRDMSDTNRRQKGALAGMGIFVNKDGSPMTTIDDKIGGQIVQNNTFSNAQTRYAGRAEQLMNHEEEMGGFNGALMTDGNTEGMGYLRAGRRLPPGAVEMVLGEEVFVGADAPHLLQSVEQDIVTFTRPTSTELNQSVQNATPFSNFQPPVRTPLMLVNGMQTGELRPTPPQSRSLDDLISERISTARNKGGKHMGEKKTGVTKASWISQGIKRGDPTVLAYVEQEKRAAAAAKTKHSIAKIRYNTPTVINNEPRRRLFGTPAVNPDRLTPSLI